MLPFDKSWRIYASSLTRMVVDAVSLLCEGLQSALDNPVEALSIITERATDMLNQCDERQAVKRTRPRASIASGWVSP